VATAQRALNIAESVNEHRAIARASYVLDQALVDCGRPHEATHSPRALEIYRALGDPERESAVLNNLGSFAYCRGDWDGAIDWYRQQAERSERAGNPADVAFTDCNIGEILSDQGRWDEAVDHLKRARRVWSATGDVQAVAFANALLGRAAVRSGQVEEGRAMLEQAEAELRGFGLHGYADFVACLVCEAHALGGDADLALRASEPLLQSADRYVPLLRRARGMAFGRLGERDAAIRELERALVEARTRAADYDIAATLDALELMAGHDPLRARERDLIAARLHVERMPAPVPAPGAKFASLSPITASASPALAP
jgi:tetratricopeptide (TPR) repeat protein